MFRFKQFAVRQDRCAMKVGTDGVLVGAWAEVRPSDRRMLDIGTGTGLIALMLAQRAPQAQITGIDIEEVFEARENADASPWGGRIVFERCAVQAFAPAFRYDLIVSNPPFFVDSLTSPDAGRTTARHAVRLSFEALRDAARRLLVPGGRFALILPTAEAARFETICRGTLSLRRLTAVRTTPRRAPKRMLLEFSLPAQTQADGAAAVSVPAATAPSAAVSVPVRPVPSALPGSALPPDPAPALRDAASGSFAGFPASENAASRPVSAPVCTELVIGTGEHETYTPEYRALTRDFYLKF